LGRSNYYSRIEKGKNKMAEIFEKLQYAKNAVIRMVEDADVCVDFHGLTYWASEVERLREEIEDML